MSKEREFNERITRLEKALSSLHAGYQRLPALNILSQDTQINGDLIVEGSITNSPGWRDYTATLVGTGGSAGAYAEDLTYARYYRIGNLCVMTVRKRITTIGSWTGGLRLLYPVARAGTHAPVIGSGGIWANAGAAASPKGIVAMGSGSYCSFYKTLIADLSWTDIAVNDILLVNTIYEI